MRLPGERESSSSKMIKGIRCTSAKLDRLLGTRSSRSPTAAPNEDDRPLLVHQCQCERLRQVLRGGETTQRTFLVGRTQDMSFILIPNNGEDIQVNAWNWRYVSLGATLKASILTLLISLTLAWPHERGTHNPGRKRPASIRTNWPGISLIRMQNENRSRQKGL